MLFVWVYNIEISSLLISPLLFSQRVDAPLCHYPDTLDM